MALPRTLDEIFRLPRITFVDRGLLPASSGIYFVIIQAQAARLAYIGKAESFSARWTGHHRIPDFELLTSLGIAVEIAWTNVETPQLGQAEEEMIELFRPPLNARATSRTRQQRIRIDPLPGLTTTPEIIQDFRARRDNAVIALQADDLWAACNEEDGDLLTVWAYPDETVLVSLHDTWGYRDTHPLAPTRVPTPPAFRANDTGVVVPKAGFQATAAERRQWTMEVAFQLDAWLAGVVEYHGAIVSSDVRRDVLVALSREKTASMLYAENPH
jgi:hypothetical protein